MSRRADPPEAALPVAYWQEWQEKCAVLRCGADAQAGLGAFGRRCLRTALRRFDAAGLAAEYAGRDAPPHAAWCAFEVHMHTPRQRDGKLWKAWLFARFAWPPYGSATPDAEQLQAYLGKSVFRTLARRLVCEEDPDARDSRGHRRPQAEHDRDGEDRSLDDLLPPDATLPGEALERQEILALTGELAEELWPRLDRRARLLLAAERYHRPLDHTDVLKLLGCAKSQAYAHRRAIDKKARACCARRHPTECPEVLQDMAEVLVLKLQTLSGDWAAGPENLLPGLLAIPEKYRGAP